MSLTVDNRNQQIRALQAKRRSAAHLADDEAWRDFLEKETGSRSVSAMTERQRRMVLAALDKLSGGGVRRYADSRQMAKIRALWAELAGLGVLVDRSDQALEAFIKNQTKQDMGKLMPAAATKVIEGLKSWLSRVQKKAS